MLQKLWRSDELIWLPSQYTKESNEAGIMTLDTRLGLDEKTFSMLAQKIRLIRHLNSSYSRFKLMVLLMVYAICIFL